MPAMREQMEPKLAKLPFFIGDVVLLGAAYFIFSQSKLPMGVWPLLFVLVCVAGGACLGIMPFLLEYRLALKLNEARTLTSVAAQMENIERLSQQIASATGQWQEVQEQSQKTAGAAKGIADRMGVEVKGFMEFMQRSNDSEKATLRLEVEKLRRAEVDWIQALVRMLDHVYALHAGGLRSGQASLIEQLGNFQNACRDAARRVGLSPFVAGASELFDPERHQPAEPNGAVPSGAKVAETVATGYTFQGRLLRPALVRISTAPEEPVKEGKVLAQA
jgi:molecular chaperone GrpE (heat shock protein)